MPTTRRSALALGLVVVSCGTAAPVLGKVPDLSPDADLIRLCMRLTEIEAELDLLFDQRETMDDEVRTQPEMDRLEELVDETRDAVEEHLPAQTMEGARAVARAALAVGRAAGGEWFVDHDFVQTLGVSLIEFVAAVPQA